MSLDTFGQVRSLMQASSLSSAQRAELWDLLEAHATQNARSYTHQWLPYLRDFPHHFAHTLSRI